jgi:hypothetical protein
VFSHSLDPELTSQGTACASVTGALSIPISSSTARCSSPHDENKFGQGDELKRALIALLLVACAATGSDTDASWSAPVNGVRARLIVLPAEKADSPFCRVLIEIENIDEVAGQKRIRFSPDRLELHVVDENGRELPLANHPYDGKSPLWEPTLLPYRGTIRFQISFPGLGYRPATDKTIVDVGSSKAWIIPSVDSAYWLWGRLTVHEQHGDHRYMDWSGSLQLPKTEIPKSRMTDGVQRQR